MPMVKTAQINKRLRSWQHFSTDIPEAKVHPPLCNGTAYDPDAEKSTVSVWAKWRSGALAHSCQGIRQHKHLKCRLKGYKCPPVARTSDRLLSFWSNRFRKSRLKPVLPTKQDSFWPAWTSLRSRGRCFAVAHHNSQIPGLQTNLLLHIRVVPYEQFSHQVHKCLQCFRKTEVIPREECFT